MPWNNADIFVRSCNQERSAMEAKAAEEAKAAGLAAEPDATAAEDWQQQHAVLQRFYWVTSARMQISTACWPAPLHPLAEAAVFWMT